MSTEALRAVSAMSFPFVQTIDSLRYRIGDGEYSAFVLTWDTCAPKHMDLPDVWQSHVHSCSSTKSDVNGNFRAAMRADDERTIGSQRRRLACVEQEPCMPWPICVGCVLCIGQRAVDMCALLEKSNDVSVLL